jgi:hypothetical protein
MRHLAPFVLLTLGVVSGPLAATADDAIPTKGGKVFAHRTVLAVRDFAQDDPRWGDLRLGPSPDTLADEGCAVTSVAMVLRYYGLACDPGCLDHFLARHEGFDDDGLLDFERVTAYAPAQIRLAYQGPLSHDALDRSIVAGHPVIVQLTLHDGGRHFVVIVGKEGREYLVRDPAAYVDMSLVPLSSLADRIEDAYLYLPSDAAARRSPTID